MGFLDSLLNVCRSISDVLHILVYLSIVIIAIIIALYRYDVALYTKYVYSPVFWFLIRHRFLVPSRPFSLKRRAAREPITYSWSVGSNRLPYIVKAIKNFINRFKK